VDASVVVLVALAALALVALIGLAAAVWWAWEPRWLPRARHAWQELGLRTSATWAEFVDWVRLGR
jgi:hypothetical protein